MLLSLLLTLPLELLLSHWSLLLIPSHCCCCQSGCCYCYVRYMGVATIIVTVLFFVSFVMVVQVGYIPVVVAMDGVVTFAVTVVATVAFTLMWSVVSV